MFMSLETRMKGGFAAPPPPTRYLIIGGGLERLAQARYLTCSLVVLLTANWPDHVCQNDYHCCAVKPWKVAQEYFYGNWQSFLGSTPLALKWNGWITKWFATSSELFNVWYLEEYIFTNNGGLKVGHSKANCARHDILIYTVWTAGQPISVHVYKIRKHP